MQNELVRIFSNYACSILKITFNGYGQAVRLGYIISTQVEMLMLRILKKFIACEMESALGRVCHKANTHGIEFYFLVEFCG